MSSEALYLFGDQIAELLPSIQELSRLVDNSHNLSGFFRRSTDRLQRAIANTSSHHRRHFSSFGSPLELATAIEKDGRSSALTTALLCISQFGHIIMYVEDPTLTLS